jgi:hypothetical protein
MDDGERSRSNRRPPSQQNKIHNAHLRKQIAVIAAKSKREGDGCDKEQGKG